jgi:hypothetical protein
MWLLVAGSGLVLGIAIGLATTGVGFLMSRNDFEPGIGHPGMECREARVKIERLQQQILAMKEQSEVVE